jgi:predicted RNA-binding protein associated with RNAse of E/G family
LTGRPVTIHYRRPPDRIQRFEQAIVEETDEHVVTYLARADLSRPIVVAGEVVLEDGSPVVWFTYPGAWHDIGRFHRADGTFTGIYANVLTPVKMRDGEWETTDLFLDLWIPLAGGAMVLDEEELAAAVAAGWVAQETAQRAREEAASLLARAAAHEWPPAHVSWWTLERVREQLGGEG